MVPNHSDNLQTTVETSRAWVERELQTTVLPVESSVSIPSPGP